MIHNFDSSIWSLGGKFFHYSDVGELREHGNVRILSDEQHEIEHTVSGVVSSLLIHEKLCINVDNFLRLVKVFGFEDAKLLLTSGVLEIVDDGPYHSVLIRECEDASKVMSVTTIQDALGHKHNAFNDLESTLKYHFQGTQSKVRLKQNELGTLSVLIEKHGVLAYDNNSTNKRLGAEIKYDLGNKNLTSKFGIVSTDTERIADRDIFKVLRLLNLNRGLICAGEIQANSVLVDSIVHPMLQVKISPALTRSNVAPPVDIFQDTLSKKGIPDLGLLYIKRVMSMHDILTLRESVDGQIFRKWLTNVNYNQEEIFKTLLNRSLPSVRSTIVKYFRWLYPNVIGLVAPITGIALDYADSFIVEKILQGWHPSMFLDDKLRLKVEKRLDILEKSQVQSNIRKRFPNIGRNDLCPCESGKKFKKCCGK